MATSPLKTDRKTYAAEFVKADYDRAVFMGHPLMDSMFTSITALAMNVWTIQRRMRIVEILLEKNGAVTREMIEKYQPTEEEAAKLHAERSLFVAEIYDPYKESGDVGYGGSLHVPGLEP